VERPQGCPRPHGRLHSQHPDWSGVRGGPWGSVGMQPADGLAVDLHPAPLQRGPTPPPAAAGPPCGNYGYGYGYGIVGEEGALG